MRQGSCKLSLDSFISAVTAATKLHKPSAKALVSVPHLPKGETKEADLPKVVLRYLTMAQKKMVCYQDRSHLSEVDLIRGWTLSLWQCSQ